jgi:hypothetical protein
MQKLYDRICNVCLTIIVSPYIEVTTINGDKRHYCNDECRLKHSEKNIKQINYIKND